MGIRTIFSEPFGVVRPRRRLLAAALIGCAAAATGAAPATAVPPPPGPGTFTVITTPSSDVHFAYDAALGLANNHFTVSGVASPDVTAVDIVCLFNSGTSHHTTLASTVPVQANGTFSIQVTLQVAFTNNCRLRATPVTIVSFDGYLGSYQGPLLYTNAAVPDRDAGSVQYGFHAIAESGEGQLQFSDAATCDNDAYLFYALPNLVRTLGSARCAFTLGYGNLGPAGPSTSSQVVVDGHPAYLPGAVHDYLKVAKGLPVTQQALTTTTTSVAANGDATVTESAPLKRCSHDDAYPPTLTSCPSLVDAGVTFVRTRVFTQSGRQAVVRDSFVSSDAGAHAVAAEYQHTVFTPSTGTPGFAFNGGGFAPVSTDQVVTGFAAGTGSMLFRSDLHAAADDPDADTLGLTWSRPPAAVVFGHLSPNIFAMRYALTVPAGASTSLGFAESESRSTSVTQSLAAAAEAGMLAAPTITAPGSGARVGSQATTVTGTVTAGANGLPVSVTVNGHAAPTTPTSATTANFAVHIALPWGTHPITVVATDAGGIRRSSSVTVTNSPAASLGSRARASGPKLLVPVTCQRFAPSTCAARLVVKSARGAVLGSTRAFSVGRGRSLTAQVRIRPAGHTVRVYLYEREPTGAYVLAAVKTYRI